MDPGREAQAVRGLEAQEAPDWVEWVREVVVPRGRGLEALGTEARGWEEREHWAPGLAGKAMAAPGWVEVGTEVLAKGALGSGVHEALAKEAEVPAAPVKAAWGWAELGREEMVAAVL